MTTPERIFAAADRIAGYARITPLLGSPALDALAGRRVLVKAECLQHTGSFKYRGAKSAVTSLAQTGWRGGVIAYSSGNHAQGVARAAAEEGMEAVIVMPSDAPKVKIDGTRALGAEVVTYDRATESREEIGQTLAAARGLHLIRPYDDRDVIAGQGTVGLEIARQAGELGVRHADVLVCCGGGGLTSGIAIALAEEAPGMTVHPVEPAGFDDVARSLAAGSIQHNEKLTGSICDAIVTPAPGEITFPILARLCGKGLVVTDDEALRAVGLAARHLKITVEPGGAVALAAALFHGGEIEGDAVIAVASGGNVDAGTLARALSLTE